VIIKCIRVVIKIEMMLHDLLTVSSENTQEIASQSLRIESFSDELILEPK
jgi:hypothetical protein